MRKAVKVLGIISAVLVVAGAVMRILHFPGHGLLMVLGAGVFAGVVLPLHFLYRRSVAQTRLQKLLEGLGTLVQMHLVILGLFLAQGWSGWFGLLMQTIVLLLAYIIFFFTGTSRSEQDFRFHTPLNRLVILVLLPLAFFGVLRYLGANESERLVQLNEIEVRRYDSLGNVVLSRYTQALSDSSLDSTRSDVEAFRMNAVALINFIQKVQMKFAAECNYGISSGELDSSMKLQHPYDYGMVVVHFIGADVQNPTGRAVEMYDSLAYYRDHVLHADVPFFVRKNSTQEDKVQWVKDNFYHATAIEVMTRLTLHKENIYQSMQYSIDHNLFVQRQ